MKIRTPAPDLFSHADKAKLKTGFYEALAQLNPDQRKAVETIEGPVMVLAGPGTGKTQVLAARIGYILDHTDTAIHQILCLTYTEAGVMAMRDRLIKFIGPAAHSAHIYTYHSFCNKVIQENPEYFFDFKKYKTASRLQIYEIVETVLNELPDDHILKRVIGDKVYDIRRLATQYENIKKEERNIDLLVTQIRAFMDKMATDPEYIYKVGKNKGEYKNNYAEDLAKFSRAIDALKTFYSYNDKMHARQLIDFQDMLLQVKNAFHQYPDLLSKYQENYLYFLVDEFQDTNGIQNNILLSLVNYWEQPNLFVVGDDDQAIFRFQGADEQNLLSIIHKYPSLELICITENYRSTQHILNAANTIIEKIVHGRVQSFELEIPPAIFEKINKTLVAAKSYIHNVPPSLKAYQNAQQETLAVYEFIRSKWLEDSTSLSEIAILCRRNKTIADLAYLLELDGIPINLKYGKNILEEPLIQHFVLLLQYLDAEYHQSQLGEEYLIQLMYLPYWGLPTQDVAKIAFLERKVRGAKNFATKILDPEAWPDVLFENKPKLEEFILNTRRWMACIPPVQILTTLCEDISRVSGLLNWALDSKERTWHLRVLNTFFQFIKNELHTIPHLNLTTLLARIQKMNDFDIAISVEAGYTVANGVNLITAHGAKGLEYDIVWIMNAVETEWEKYFGSGDTPYKLPKTLKQIEPNKDSRLVDERRLFYVAMTRARQNLIISWPIDRTDNGGFTKSAFVTELSEYLNIPEHIPQAVSEDLLIKKMQLIQNRNLTPPDLIDHNLIDEFIEHFVLSSTALNLYLDCPRKFYFEEILRVPRGENAHLGLGITVHQALHDFFHQGLKAKEYDGQMLVEYFKTALMNHAWYFTNTEYEGLIRRFSNQLPLFLRQHINQWFDVDHYKLEYYLDRVDFEGIPINGKIDQVIKKGEETIIIDFKSGRGDSTGSTNKAKKPYKENNGGEYWRQGAFYKFLLDRDPSYTWKANGARFFFLQSDKLAPDDFRAPTFTYSHDDLALVTRLIKETFQNIKDHKFDTGCNLPECEWCSYVKTRQLVINSEHILF